MTSFYFMVVSPGSGVSFPPPQALQVAVTTVCLDLYNINMFQTCFLSKKRCTFGDHSLPDQDHKSCSTHNVSARHYIGLSVQQLWSLSFFFNDGGFTSSLFEVTTLCVKITEIIANFWRVSVGVNSRYITAGVSNTPAGLIGPILFFLRVLFRLLMYSTKHLQNKTHKFNDKVKTKQN